MTKQARICPVCGKTEIVAANVEICGMCQYRLFEKVRKKENDLKSLGIENGWWSNLNARDLVFLAKHLGGCATSTLSLHLGKCKNAIRNSIIRGKLEGNCEGGLWQVTFVGIIWAVYISSDNWVTFPGAALIAGVNLTTLHAWYKEGLFGKARINISGRKVLNRTQVEKLTPSIKEQKRQNSLQGINPLQEDIRADELPVSVLARISGVDSDTISYWIKCKGLPSRLSQDGKIRLVRKSDFDSFALKAVARQVVITHRLRDSLKQYVARQSR